MLALPASAELSSLVALGRRGTPAAQWGMMHTRLVSVGLAIVLATGGATLLGGCREKGPGEKAGEKVDNAMDKLEDKLDPKGPAEKAGRKIDKAIDDAKN